MESRRLRRSGLPVHRAGTARGRRRDRAGGRQLPSLVSEGDLRGILHAHTDQSDGTFSLEDMAEATRERGFDISALPTIRRAPAMPGA
jgi:DNA polymerase (family 10)